MKKFSIFAVAALMGAAMVSCDEYTLPNPPAQSNPEEVEFNADDLTLTSLINGTVNLQTLSDEHVPATLFDVAVKNLPADYRLRLVAEMSATDDFAKTVDVPTTITEDSMVTIGTSDIQAAFVELVSKAPDARDMYIRVPAYAVNGTSTVRLGTADTYYYTGIINVLPLQPAVMIESTYYLVGNFCDWDLSKGIEFSQVTPGNPYDFPEFSVKIDVDYDMASSANGYMWKVVPGSAVANKDWAGALGVLPGDSDTKGSLVTAPEAQAQAGVIKQEGPYMININLEKLSYDVQPAFEYLWVPGYGSSTNNFSKIMRLTTTNYMDYVGTMHLRNRFWFTGQESTRGVNFRPDGEDNPVGPNGELSGKMIYDVTSTAMMKVPTDGLYLIRANVVTLEWSATPIPVISIIGGFNGWDTATAVDLVHNKTFDVWTVENIDLPAGSFKFCVNHDWAISYGGAFDNIVENGGDLSIDQAGTYTVALNFNVFPNTVTITKK